MSRTYLVLMQRLLPPACQFGDVSGDACDQDYDGCGIVPCGVDGSCQDATPAEEQTNGTQYTCLACGSGYDLISSGECVGWFA